jgi:hypothetical protein
MTMEKDNKLELSASTVAFITEEEGYMFWSG